MEALPIVQYWLRLLPQARRELAYWHARALTIADSVERRVALEKLKSEHQNIQSAAFFALLAEDSRPALCRVATFQVAYELLDGLNERSPRLDDGLRLHRALSHAVGGDAVQHGSYLQGLVDACRSLTSPSTTLQSAVARVGEAQARHHAHLAPRAHVPGLYWWEAAAASISSLSILAMLCTPPDQHEQLRAAYVEVDALAALLDALVDLPDDERSGNPNWLAHYPPGQISGRLDQLARRAEDAISMLPNAPIHRMLLAGLFAHNIAACRGNTATRRLKEGRPLVRAGALVLLAYRTIPRGGSSLLTTIQN